MNNFLQFNLEDNDPSEKQDLQLISLKKEVNKSLYELARISDKSATRFRSSKVRLTMKMKGIFDGFLGIQKPDGMQNSLAKQLLREKINREKNALRSEFERPIKIYKSELDCLQNDLLDEDKLKRREHLYAKRGNAEHKLDLLPLVELEENSKRLITELDELNQKRSMLLKKIGMLPTKHFDDGKYGYWVLASLLYIGEIAINYSAIVNIGEISNLFASLLAIVFSALISITAFKTAMNWQHGKKWNGVFFGLSGLFLCGIIIALRINMNVFLTLLLPVFYLFSLALSFNKAIHFDYFTTERRIKKIKNKLIKLKTKTTHLQNLDHWRKTKESTEFEGKSGTVSDVLLQKWQLHANVYERFLTQSMDMAAQQEARLDSLYKEACLTYNRTYLITSKLLFRKTQNFKFVEDIQPSQNSNEGFVFRSIKASPEKNILSLILLLIVSGCSKPDFHDVTVLVDQTHNHQSKPEELSQFVFNEILSLEEGVPKDAIHLTVSTIGDLSKQKEKKVGLSKGDPWFLAKDADRKQEITIFTSMVDSLLQQVITSENTFELSFIHQNIATHLNRMAKVKSKSSRTLIVFSDLLLHTPALSFYNNKDVLKSREKLANQLLEIKELEDCTGIIIYLVHLPDRSTDNLFSMALDFWTWFYENKGAQVIYKPGV